MYKYLRLIKKFIYKIRSLVLFPFVVISYGKFITRDKHSRFTLPFLRVAPVLFENTPYTRFDTHYIYHTAWAARKVKEINKEKHVDISSSLYFSSIVSAFVPVEFFDYRPANLNLGGLTSSSANLTSLHFKDRSIASISCMHTVEHVGLGRYGDAIDPDGDLKAAKELQRVVAEKGSLLFVVPVGRPVIEFNAHRIYSYQMVLNMFPELTLKEFSLIPDNALTEGMIFNASPQMVSKQQYGCGCFWFVRE
jgi:hypothetical protein